MPRFWKLDIKIKEARRCRSCLHDSKERTANLALVETVKIFENGANRFNQAVENTPREAYPTLGVVTVSTTHMKKSNRTATLMLSTVGSVHNRSEIQWDKKFTNGATWTYIADGCMRCRWEFAGWFHLQPWRDIYDLQSVYGFFVQVESIESWSEFLSWIWWPRSKQRQWGWKLYCQFRGYR